LLRIEADGFPRRNAKELRVELADLVQKSALACIKSCPASRLGIVVSVHVEAVGRNLADCVDPVAQQTPIRWPVSDTSRKAAPDADDGDRLAAGLLDGLQPGTCFL
jgi:hypothetical protein